LRIVISGEGGVAVRGYAAHILKTIKRKPKTTLIDADDPRHYFKHHKHFSCE